MMKRGFTLIELLTVVGIIGFLGLAAASSYSALRRGIAERGAVAVATSFLREAQERAHIDRLPTKVFCYNRLVKEPSGQEDVGIVVGIMTAIRRSGRITAIGAGNKLLYDEYADLDSTYEWVETSADADQYGGNMRLFKFDASSDMSYTTVSDLIVRDSESVLATIFSGAIPGGATNLLSSAFFDRQRGQNVPSWKVGDAYGFEFAEVQLPDGFVFGKKDIPTKMGDIKIEKTYYFKANDDLNDAIEIWSTKPDGSGRPKIFKKAGEARSGKGKSL